ncbi:hypothetical protein B0I35DRAFT_80997 [Stachybotrys elegans]|uniref:RING-type E3 ubiquitin transferase n=1 Tax=Stachybotrys elegans TaxID=80388 RepID=A0A8K0WMW4_9HYPO|nr:hypothetical protein B0I35DRAFT_80997 [Stachybotrys elegans]
MPKMRLGWYAGASTALAGCVVLSAFHQRSNFYSAMVYLAQSNFCLLVMVNFTLLLYSSFVYGLTRLCFGTLRAVEVEQLTERAWFAITETCLAMTIFREEIGAWFLVMFTALVTGKVWGWIGDGRVEILEQQPPANPRLFHVRLSVSLAISFLYDVWLLRYTINTVVQQAKPNMMVMFLFEFAVLTTSSWRTAVRYILSIAEQSIVKAQTRQKLHERRMEVRRERETILRQREQAIAAGEEVSPIPDDLPNEEDIDEMDIEVPGWAPKGELVLWLDLVTDMIKLGIYVALFFMLLRFYGLPIHMMRDLFMTSRDFVKRLNALLRYRRAIQEMKRYPDANQEDLDRENTCIICREEMRPWDPVNNPTAIDRVRPKKLPCGHILHLGCLKSWLERQQVCPTCRAPVSEERPRVQNRVNGIRIQIGGPGNQRQQQPPANENAGAAPAGQNNPPPQGDAPRVFNFGPIRVGFGANDQQVRQLAQQFGAVPAQADQGAGVVPTPVAAPVPVVPSVAPPSPLPTSGDNLHNISIMLQQAERLVQREVLALQSSQQELQTVHLLLAELQRLRLRQQQQQQQDPILTTPFPGAPNLAFPQPPMPHLQNTFNMPLMHGGLPPRISSPFVARHGTASSATAIPAGSADLPEGVVIPPGWSLMPLQRFDGGPQLRQASPSPGPSNLGRQPVSDGHQTTSFPPPAAATSSGVEEAQSSLSEGSRVRQTEAPTVVSPSPVAPNWGGRAQIFRSMPRSDQSETVSQEDSQDESARDRSTSRGPSGSSAKAGPAAAGRSSETGPRPVTVEDAKEDSDDSNEEDEESDSDSTGGNELPRTNSG